jgi:hypothetical protein
VIRINQPVLSAFWQRLVWLYDVLVSYDHKIVSSCQSGSLYGSFGHFVSARADHANFTAVKAVTIASSERSTEAPSETGVKPYSPVRA